MSDAATLSAASASRVDRRASARTEATVVAAGASISCSMRERRSVVHLTLGYDHRLIDGAVADQFMVVVKKALEGWSEDVG